MRSRKRKTPDCMVRFGHNRGVGDWRLPTPGGNHQCFPVIQYFPTTFLLFVYGSPTAGNPTDSEVRKKKFTARRLRRPAPLATNYHYNFLTVYDSQLWSWYRGARSIPLGLPASITHLVCSNRSSETSPIEPARIFEVIVGKFSVPRHAPHREQLQEFVDHVLARDAVIDLLSTLPLVVRSNTKSHVQTSFGYSAHALSLVPKRRFLCFFCGTLSPSRRSEVTGRVQAAGRV